MSNGVKQLTLMDYLILFSYVLIFMADILIARESSFVWSGKTSDLWLHSVDLIINIWRLMTFSNFFLCNNILNIQCLNNVENVRNGNHYSFIIAHYSRSPC